MKKNIDITKANRLLNTGAVILVSSKLKDKTNIITMAWQMPLQHNPPLVGICMGKENYSYKMIEQSKEFVINIPNIDLLRQVLICGELSGKDYDKFKQSGLTPEESQKVSTPSIAECIGCLECSLKDIVEFESASIFIGNVLSARIEEGLFEGFWKVDLPKAKTIHHLGGNNFTIPGELIIT